MTPLPAPSVGNACLPVGRGPAGPEPKRVQGRRELGADHTDSKWIAEWKRR